MAAGAETVVLNVTATQPTTAGHLRVFPADEAMPTASNVNFAAGQTIANLVIAKLSPDGKVKIFNKAGTTHVFADVAGWFPAGSEYVPATPVRTLDTRSGLVPDDGHDTPLGPDRNSVVQGKE